MLDLTHLGSSLDSAIIKRGLVELNGDINFDPMSRLPSEWKPYFRDPEHFSRRLREGESEPIYYGMKYVTSLDRGIVPEFAVYEEEDGLEEIPMQDLEKYSNTSVLYYEILPSDPYYAEAFLRAEHKSDNYYFDRGKLFKRQCVRMTMVPGRIIKLGWRASLMNVASYGIPNVTRRAIETKFSIDLGQQVTVPPPVVASAQVLGGR